MKSPLLVIATLLTFALSAQEFTPDDGNRNPTFDTLDIQILLRAQSIFNQAGAWHQMDDRKCEDDIENGNFSLFCALYAASLEVMGEYDHRKPALQQVRWIIQEEYPERLDNHRLMDWNNHPDTNFDQVILVLEKAIQIIGDKIETTTR